MKILYVLKKGLQCYPPCLSQVLILNDLGYEIEVYHGKNSPFIDQMLDDRKIIHHTFKSDRNSKNMIESAKNFFTFILEVRRKQVVMDPQAILWIGNMETALSLNPKKLRGRTFILNVLELYDENTIYDRWLKKHVKNANIVISCEKHRAAIMQSRYKLAETPEVIPNKPYDINIREEFLNNDIIELIKRHFTIVYQGIISKDRPLENVARALSLIGDYDIVFLIMGDCSEQYKREIIKIYPNTIFTGFVPAPQHLCYTQYCDIGIANYDISSLNNIFCAPNKIYEYAKFSTPMLCSTNIALEESVGFSKAGLCIDFSNVEEIIDATKNIRKEYEFYSRNAFAFYNGFDIKEAVEIVIEKIR